MLSVLTSSFQDKNWFHAADQRSLSHVGSVMSGDDVGEWHLVDCQAARRQVMFQATASFVRSHMTPLRVIVDGATQKLGWGSCPLGTFATMPELALLFRIDAISWHKTCLEQVLPCFSPPYVRSLVIV